MWRLVACCPFNYSPMSGKNFFDINYLYSVITILIFIFLAFISGTCSHVASSNLKSNAEDSTPDYILCRLCGADLADAKNIINHLSPAADVIGNQTLFERKGVEVQLLKNSFGIKFHSITVSNSKCAPVHNWQRDFSWYPGYAWKPCICKRCRVHHGWLFEPVDVTDFDTNLPSNKGFFVLKLDSILSENFANSLIVTPKSYLN